MRPLPTLENLGVRIHSDLRFDSGPVECDGELVVLDTFEGWACLECCKCQDEASVKIPPDLIWQNRKDLA